MLWAHVQRQQTDWVTKDAPRGAPPNIDHMLGQIGRLLFYSVGFVWTCFLTLLFEELRGPILKDSKNVLTPIVASGLVLVRTSDFSVLL